MLLSDPNGVRATADLRDVPAWRTQAGLLLFGPLIAPGQPCRRCTDARLASQGQCRDPFADPIDLGLVTQAADALRADEAPTGLMLSYGDTGWQRHLVFPVPDCICNLGWRAPPGLSPEAAVDALVGIIGAVESSDEAGPDGEACALVLTRPCQLPALGGLPTIINGAGFGPAPQARRAALCETLERYCASFIPEGMPVSRASELGGEHVVPNPVYFGGETVTASQPIRWVAGHRLIDGRPCWVQASAIYFPYRCHDLEPRRSWGGSEGLAAGPNLHAAIIHATHEVLERDTFIRAWRFDGARRLLPARFRAADLRLVTIGNRFGIPVVSAFLESPERPYCTAGIAARWNEADAGLVAAMEALGSRALDLCVGRSRDDSIETRHAHARDPAMRAVRDGWYAGRGVVDAPPPPRNWGELVLRLPDAVAVDVTTPDVRALGIVVVRVVVPGCHGSEPLHRASRIGGNPAPAPF